MATYPHENNPIFKQLVQAFEAENGTPPNDLDKMVLTLIWLKD